MPLGSAPPGRVLFTVPVKNEAERLIPGLIALKDAFDRAGFNYRLSIAEDGSTDGTKELLPEIRRLIPGIVIQDRDAPLGRGKALRLLWAAEPADVYGFCDADLASDVGSVVNAIRLALGGAEMVIGSRYVTGARVNRPMVRSLASLLYNGVVRFAFDDGVADHQCGLKVFRAEMLAQLLRETHEDSWFWDTEAIIVAHQLGTPVLEMPVDWVERKVRRTRFRRLAADVILHGSGLVRMKSRAPPTSIGAPGRALPSETSEAVP